LRAVRMIRWRNSGGSTDCRIEVEVRFDDMLEPDAQRAGMGRPQ
jgi:hypothetical protein